MQGPLSQVLQLVRGRVSSLAHHRHQGKGGSAYSPCPRYHMADEGPVASYFTLLPSGLAHPCFCPEGELCCATQTRSTAPLPECCNWLGGGSALLSVICRRQVRGKKERHLPHTHTYCHQCSIFIVSSPDKIVPQIKVLIKKPDMT